jgi:DeoR family transcriptional regulator, fructose operon transcriptional repressor
MPIIKAIAPLLTELNQKTKGQSQNIAFVTVPSFIPDLLFPFLNRETKNRLEKRLIAEQAVSFILEGDVVFIDEGTTTLQMAGGLNRFKEITVMTTSFPLANRLMQTDFEGDIIFHGGLVQKDHWRTAGSWPPVITGRLHGHK